MQNSLFLWFSQSLLVVVVCGILFGFKRRSSEEETHGLLLLVPVSVCVLGVCEM